MLLDDSTTGGVVYVSKDTYDQALLLHSRFDGNTRRILDTILNEKITTGYVTNPKLSGLAEKMGKVLPAPINILAPFLAMVSPNENISWDENNLELGYGVLHMLSQMIDFNATTLVPKEIRAQVSIPTVVLMQYQSSWDSLCSTLADQVVPMPVQSIPIDQPIPRAIPIPTNQSNTNATQVVTTPAAMPTSEVSSDDGNVMSDSDFDSLQAKLAAIMAEPETKPSKDEQVTKKEDPKPVPNMAPTTTQSEKEESSSVLDEFDV